MPFDPDFKRAIEEVKLRTPLEEVVRERVPELRKRGRLWEACCPFHEEKTPSFKVDTARGTWRCYGACQKGGDLISFVQESQNLSFGDALELLAARAGVELPRRRGRAERSDDDPGLAALAEADAFFQRELRREGGREAREYLRARGIGENTVSAFGLGWAPRGGQILVGAAQRAAEERPELGLAVWEKAGLLRRSDDGEPYAFFRGRLTIPIRDRQGRTVGFGARRLDDSAGGPKYVNTPDTPWFHKGRLVYALDRAIDEVRRSGHLILVEGYTDVMAAHQAGISTVCAVLGTATTDEHAGLVRSAGARRVTLVFDGDEAGRTAAWRALHGLLPLDVELDVVTLPAGQDPADLLAEGGAQPFLARLELAQGWFDFAREGLRGLGSKELALAVDRILTLLDRVPKPVQRDALLRELAGALDMPLATLRDAWHALPERRRARQTAEGRQADEGHRKAGRAAPPRDAAAGKTVDRRVLQAYQALVGAVLVDPGLFPRVRGWIERCPSAGLAAVLGAVSDLFEDEDAEIDESTVMTALGDHPVRGHVSSLREHALASDYPPHELLDATIRFLTTHANEEEKRRLRETIAALQRAADLGDEDAAGELARACERLSELHKNPTAGGTTAGAA